MEITGMLSEGRKEELEGIFREVHQKETKESRLVQALDKLEAVIQHNEASIDTWLPLEYDLQFTYGQDQTKDIPYMKKLRQRVYRDTLEKISRESHFIEKTFLCQRIPDCNLATSGCLPKYFILYPFKNQHISKKALRFPVNRCKPTKNVAE